MRRRGSRPRPTEGMHLPHQTVAKASTPTICWTSRRSTPRPLPSSSPTPIVSLSPSDLPSAPSLPSPPPPRLSTPPRPSHCRPLPLSSSHLAGLPPAPLTYPLLPSQRRFLHHLLALPLSCGAVCPPSRKASAAPSHPCLLPTQRRLALQAGVAASVSLNPILPGLTNATAGGAFPSSKDRTIQEQTALKGRCTYFGKSRVRLT